MKDDFKKKTLSGISWSFVNQITRQLMTIVISVVLARLLSPDEFGVVGMITVFSGFAFLFLDVGFSGALIQKKDLTQTDLSTVFWFNVFIGIGLTLLFFLLSPFIADFYDNSALVNVTRVISFQFLISSLGIVQNTVLTRAVNIKKQTVIGLSSMVVGGGLAIIMALGGFSYWSIVFQGLIASVVSLIVLWFTSDWRPSFVFKKEALMSMLKFSSAMFSNSTLTYWSRNADNMLIGKFLGSADLGLYSRAYALLLFPLNNISRTIGRVLFPSFSSIQDDVPRVRNAFMKVTQVIAFITVPTAFGIFATADNLVMVLFGEQWLGMVPLVRILSLLGAFQSIFTVGGAVYHSLGRPDIPLKINMLASFLMISGISIGLYIGGIVEVAIGYAIGSMLNLLPNLYFLSRMLGISVKQFIKNFTPQFLISLFMCILVSIIDFWINDHSNSLFFLVAQVVIGTSSYFLLNQVFKTNTYVEILDMVREYIYNRKTTVSN